MRTHVSVPTSDDLRVKDVRELRVDAQRLLDSREREEPEEGSPSRHDEEARSPVEAFFDDEAPAPPTTAPAAAAAVAAPSGVAKLPLDESQEVVGLLPLLEEPDI